MSDADLALLAGTPDLTTRIQASRRLGPMNLGVVPLDYPGLFLLRGATEEAGFWWAAPGVRRRDRPCTTQTSGRSRRQRPRPRPCSFRRGFLWGRFTLQARVRWAGRRIRRLPRRVS